MRLTHEEEGLLLYLETRVVDHSGKVDTARMNNADMAIADCWNNDNFIRFGRIPAKLQMAATTRGAVTHWVIFSPGAFGHASQLRAERADRGVERLRKFLEPCKGTAVAKAAFIGQDTSAEPTRGHGNGITDGSPQ